MVSIGSFAAVTNSINFICCRHVDGHDYMYALSEMLDSAKECIFILVGSSAYTGFLEYSLSCCA